MFRNVIAPIQAWLLSQNRCVGCGTPLKKGKVENKDKNTEKVVCSCGRIFIHDLKGGRYRRALFDEV